MKTGSLVVCVDDSGLVNTKKLVKGKIYTVRDVLNRRCGIGVLLEEIVNGVHHFEHAEFGYRIERFRELDTPTEIKLEEILELELV